MRNLESILSYSRAYLRNRPLFLALIRTKELELYQRYFTQVQLALKSFGRVRKPEVILDFGCGDGFFMRQIRENIGRKSEAYGKNAKIIGLEVDGRKAVEARREFFYLRKRRSSTEKVKNVYQRVVLYDGERIPFGDNYFDKVLSNCVLEHINRRTYNIEHTLKEIYRVLKPGGRFYVTVMTKNWEKYLLGNLVLGKIYQKWMRKIQKHSNLLTAKGWRKGFVDAQFRVIKMVGYLDRRACRWMDFLHYVSIGSLISYKLFGRWVLFPWQYDLLPVEHWIAGLIEKDVPVEKAAALFFILKK